MEFSFKNVKKEHLRIELIDDSFITLRPPRQSELRKLSALDNLKTDEDVYAAIADILNMNLEGRKFSGKNVGELFDVQDIGALVGAVHDWINRLVNQKN